MKLNNFLKLLVISMSLIQAAYCWDDHPDRQDHKESDRIFNDAQDQNSSCRNCRDDYRYEADSRNSNEMACNSGRCGTIFDEPDRDK